eukprot:4260188-Pyramimonas_sp.AAC.1
MGLVPVGTYGDGVTGRAWSRIEPLRRAAHLALYPRVHGRSATMDLAIQAAPHTVDPAYACTVGPIGNFARA